MKKLITEEFIAKAKKIHGNKYDYSEVVYISNKNKVKIICFTHGDFEQIAGDHLNGSGCPSCKAEKISRKFISNINEFITKAKEVHGDKYDYSKVDYVKSTIKVIITCKLHGDFLQTPNDHLTGRGCLECKKIKIGNLKRYDKDIFIQKAINIHGDLFDYSRVNYINSVTPVEIICNKDKTVFFQTPSSHTQGHGCPCCGVNKLRILFSFTLEEFIEKAIAIHGFKYNYSKVEYINSKTKVTITCPKHGDFEQIVELHLNGNGCRKCKCSKGEKLIIKALDENNIKYIHQFRLPELNLLYRYDFYLPDYNLLIEFQGGQHYFPVEWFGGEAGFLETKRRDAFKKYLAKETKRNILYINYKELKFPVEIFVKNLIKKIYKHKYIVKAPVVVSSSI